MVPGSLRAAQNVECRDFYFDRYDRYETVTTVTFDRYDRYDRYVLTVSDRYG